MKKLIYPIIACSAIVATAALAGGPELITPAPAAAPSIIPFIDAQLGAAWRDVDNINTPVFNGPIGGAGSPVLVTPGFNHSDNHFAGRVAAGLQFPITPVFKVTSEVGFGYYNRDRFNQLTTLTAGSAAVAPVVPGQLLASSSTNIKVSTWGMDAFVGGMYTVYNNIDLFAKVGGMVETYRTEFNNLTTVGVVTPATFNTSFTADRTSAVPAVMVGAQYDITQWLGIHVAYLHSFGSNYRLLSVTGTTAPLNTAVSTRLVAPSINAVFGGLEFRLPT